MSKNMSFQEKLQMISEIYFENHKQTISEEEMASVENNLQITIPESLREFYFMFGNDINLLKCMYDIAVPRELYLENNILMLARQMQNLLRNWRSICSGFPTLREKASFLAAKMA